MSSRGSHEHAHCHCRDGSFWCSILQVKLITIITLVFLAASCTPEGQVKPIPEMPNKIVWAWERSEDLRFLDTKEFGVAFLAQTLVLEKDRVDQKARRQPLEVSPGTYLMAVTRIETIKETNRRPAYSDEQIAKLVELIDRTLELPNVKGIQIDFDAVVSEREFYRKLISRIRNSLSAKNEASEQGSPLSSNTILLTMTSLASWCTGDAWFSNFPVDEAVPMVFEMGADSEKVRNYLRNGNDWQEPLCRGSYGVSIDEPKLENLKQNRRIFYFKNSSWSRADLERL